VTVRTWRFALLCVLFGAVLGRVSAAAEPIAPPGSRIALVPPAGFTIAHGFSGFENKDIGASIVLTELPGGAFAEVRSGVTPEALATRGVLRVSPIAVPAAAYEHVAIRGEQQTGGILHDKWILFFDGGSFVGIVTANVPRHDPTALSEPAAVAMLASARIVAPAGDAVAALPFTFDPGARFRHRTALAGRSALLSETPPPQKHHEATMTIAVVADRPVPPAEQQRFGLALLRGLKALEVRSVVEAEPIAVAGMSGFEYLADARSPGSGESVRLLAAALFTERSGYVLIGAAAPAVFDAAVPDFRSVIASFRPKP
jgi:hypothetical protein